MLYLITGPNGGAKSLRAIQKMHELHAQGINIYAHGFHDLRNMPFDVEEAQSIHPRDWKDMPPGSAMFVDECQKIWRTRRGNKEPPPELMEMEEHRYEGVDIYLITQDPSYFDSHIKGLVTKHWHCVGYGDKASRVFAFSECQDNPQGIAKRASAEFEVWPHPVQYYDCYTSAKTHMKKPPIPWRHRLPKVMVWGAVALIVLAVCALFFGWGNPEKKQVIAGEAPQERASFFGSRLSSVGGEPAPPMTPDEWYARFTPRVPHIPMSAPVYDNREIAAEPRAYCVIGHAGTDAQGNYRGEACRCITEQGTRWGMPEPMCRMIVETGGVYDHYKAPAQSREDFGAPRGDFQQPRHSASGSPVVIAGDQVSAYGDLGITNRP